MLGFSLARLEYLDFTGRFAKGSSPGEWYWYRTNHYRIGITIHLGCILPAGVLMIWQFVPAIRHKSILFHRINGYLIVLLVLVSNVGALMIVRRSFGGELATQGAVGFLVIATTAALVIAYINIKRLQIDQHRAWMLRAMFYLGSIITTRIIMIIAAQITTMIGSYYVPFTCGELEFIEHYNTSKVYGTYPACARDGASEVAVHADFNGSVENVGASLRLNFGMAIWLALALHFIGVEFYLILTPRESRRLRQVAYERQMEAGYRNPGSAGLVPEKFGDADPWVPEVKSLESGERFGDESVREQEIKA